MGGDRRYDDGDRGILSQDCKTDFGKECKEGQRWGIRVDLGGHGIGYKGALADKGVREGAEGNNLGVCSRDNNIQTLYRRRVYGVFQYFSWVVVSITCPQLDGEEGRA